MAGHSGGTLMPVGTITCRQITAGTLLLAASATVSEATQGPNDRIIRPKAASRAFPEEAGLVTADPRNHIALAFHHKGLTVFARRRYLDVPCRYHRTNRCSAKYWTKVITHASQTYRHLYAARSKGENHLRSLINPSTDRVARSSRTPPVDTTHSKSECRSPAVILLGVHTVEINNHCAYFVAMTIGAAQGLVRTGTL
jgi:hypothetical protein